MVLAGAGGVEREGAVCHRGLASSAGDAGDDPRVDGVHGGGPEDAPEAPSAEREAGADAGDVGLRAKENFRNL